MMCNCTGTFHVLGSAGCDLTINSANGAVFAPGDIAVWLRNRRVQQHDVRERVYVKFIAGDAVWSLAEDLHTGEYLSVETADLCHAAFLGRNQ